MVAEIGNLGLKGGSTLNFKWVLCSVNTDA